MRKSFLLNKKSVLISAGVIFVFAVLLVKISHAQSTPEQDMMPICPDDAKLCPDGSSVVRIAPLCEFATCPGDEQVGVPSVPLPLVPCPTIAKACADGSYVAPTGPNCEFPACDSTEPSIPALYENELRKQLNFRREQVEILSKERLQRQVNSGNVTPLLNDDQQFRAKIRVEQVQMNLISTIDRLEAVAKKVEALSLRLKERGIETDDIENVLKDKRGEGVFGNLTQARFDAVRYGEIANEVLNSAEPVEGLLETRESASIVSDSIKLVKNNLREAVRILRYRIQTVEMSAE